MGESFFSLVDNCAGTPSGHQQRLQLSQKVCGDQTLRYPKVARRAHSWRFQSTAGGQAGVAAPLKIKALA